MKLTDREKKHVAKIIYDHMRWQYSEHAAEAVARYIESIAKRRKARGRK